MSPKTNDEITPAEIVGWYRSEAKKVPSEWPTESTCREFAKYLERLRISRKTRTVLILGRRFKVEDFDIDPKEKRLNAHLRKMGRAFRKAARDKISDLEEWAKVDQGLGEEYPDTYFGNPEFTDDVQALRVLLKAIEDAWERDVSRGRPEDWHEIAEHIFRRVAEIWRASGGKPSLYREGPVLKITYCALSRVGCCAELESVARMFERRKAPRRQK